MSWSTLIKRWRPRLAEIHQLTYGMVIENLHAHVLLKFLDRDFAGEAVIGAIEADHLGDDALDERRSLGEDGLQNGLLPLEGHDIARITISVGIARDVGDGLARLAIGDDALDLEGDPGVIVRDNLIILSPTWRGSVSRNHRPQSP